MPFLSALLKSYYELCYSLLGPITRGMDWELMRKTFESTDETVTVQKYLAAIMLSAILLFSLGFGLAFMLTIYKIAVNPIIAFLPLILPLAGISLFMAMPFYSLSTKKRSIKSLLPLAILTMSAVVESGAPPQYMFSAVARSKDYPRLGEEFAKLERYMNNLHMSISEAILTLMDHTPSVTLRRFLAELNSTIRTGGDLKEFMRKRAEKAYFEYTISVEEANKRAETFGDIYTAVLIAAPLFLFSSVMLMGIFGTSGGLFGYSIDFLLMAGIFVAIPIVNLCFIVLMEFFTPEES